MEENPFFEDLLKPFKDLADFVTGTPHPLVEAAKAYIAVTHEYDVYCEKQGVYEAARKANIDFVLRTQVPTFQTLENIVATASQDLETGGFVRPGTLKDIVATAQRIKKISTDPRASVFTAAEENYKSLDRVFKGPKTGYTLSAFINLSEKFASEATRPESKFTPSKTGPNEP